MREDDRRRGDPRPTAPHTCSAGGHRSHTVPGVYGDDGREAPHPTRDGQEATRALGAAGGGLVAPASAQGAGARRVLSLWSASAERCGGCGAVAAALGLRARGLRARGLRHARAAAHLSRQPKCASTVQGLRTRGTGSRSADGCGDAVGRIACAWETHVLERESLD